MFVYIKYMFRLRGRHNRAVSGLMSFSDSVVVSGSRDGEVCAWSILRGPDDPINTGMIARNTVTSLLKLSDVLFAQGSESLAINIFDMRQRLHAPVLKIPTGRYFPRCMAVHHRDSPSPHGTPSQSILAAGLNGFEDSGGSAVKLWDIRYTGTTMHTESVSAADAGDAPSPDAPDASETEVPVPPTVQQRGTRSGHRYGVRSLSFIDPIPGTTRTLPSLLSVGGDGTVCVWDCSKGSSDPIMQTQPSGPVASAALSRYVPETTMGGDTSIAQYSLYTGEAFGACRVQRVSINAPGLEGEGDVLPDPVSISTVGMTVGGEAAY
ncbi:hypothetical protein KIPB_006944 [Kipferlia bialata]|uniref:Uncharacterized protein n=1 Tax=Kipferlia bialata TaxID=797122 RepID=A0A9K3GK62_9EUKA|nr:hypothetical protein KIPB_006944 [Kipferlia bialata]|eukprot:g6944.t1